MCLVKFDKNECHIEKSLVRYPGSRLVSPGNSSNRFGLSEDEESTQNGCRDFKLCRRYQKKFIR